MASVAAKALADKSARLERLSFAKASESKCLVGDCRNRYKIRPISK